MRLRGWTTNRRCPPGRRRGGDTALSAMDGMRGRVGMWRGACFGLAALVLGACVAERAGPVVAPAAVRVPAEAPRVTGRERRAMPTI